ncbi:MAG: indole-3-glycerol-phosphate synthase TrpC, partial [Candidatus Peregrinibacteria bacterium]|nr:indole-3-glycerol-phosphate synthase TrpC [Candidatus Peregrinibacteria bacterium]
MNSKMPSVLKEICRRKWDNVASLLARPRGEWERAAMDQPPAKSFSQAIQGSRMKLIAEFKRASPSKGHIRPGAQPEEIASLYQESGAAAISVLTNSSFSGELEDLRRIRRVVDLPILRKDFILHPVQIY